MMHIRVFFVLISGYNFIVWDGEGAELRSCV